MSGAPRGQQPPRPGRALPRGWLALPLITAGAFAPAGPAARPVTWLTWLLNGLGAVAFAAVVAVLAWAFVRSRRGPRAGPPPDGRRLVIVLGIVLPAVVLALAFAGTLATSVAIPRDGDMDVEVIGHQFWWEVRYPQTGFVTANEIVIPAGTDVRLMLETDDVIHSFWVPELAGKRDLVPGRVNELVVHADEPGTYRGMCAEFCGIQHANMALLVEAVAAEEFDAWLDRWADGSGPPEGAVARRGFEVFAEASCAACHAIAGTPYDGRVGPALTNLAERSTLAAGVLPNTPAALATWIEAPQEIKPGTRMPPIELRAGELEALVEYLEGLG